MLDAPEDYVLVGEESTDTLVTEPKKLFIRRDRYVPGRTLSDDDTFTCFSCSIATYLPSMMCPMVGPFSQVFFGKRIRDMSLFVSIIYDQGSWGMILRRKDRTLSRFLLIPMKDGSKVFETTVQASTKSLSEAISSLREFLTSNGSDSHTVNTAAVCAEEFVVNIIRHGHTI